MSSIPDAFDHAAARWALTGNRRTDRKTVVEALLAKGVNGMSIAENIHFWINDKTNAQAAAAARHDAMKMLGIFAPDQTEQVNRFDGMRPDELMTEMIGMLEDAGQLAPGSVDKFRARLQDHVRLGGMLIPKSALPPMREDDDVIDVDMEEEEEG